MNDEERDILVNQQLSKAKHFLQQAEEMCQLHHWDLAANRYYYACFHAVQALFIHDKISGHTHAGMIRQFSLYYVKEKLIDLSYGSFLARLMQLRQKADYNCAYDITKEEIFDMQPRAIEFVRAIETLIHRPS